MSRRRRGGRKRSRAPWVILGLVIVTAVVVYYIFTQSGVGNGSPLNNQPVSSTMLNQLGGVSQATLNSVGGGASGVNGLTPITTSATPLTQNGKPELLYMGAEYCPFCAVERWSMIVALDKFGTFTGLKYTQSAPLPEAYPNTSTFTFSTANYSSSYISFVTVEQNDRNRAPLQTATSAQTALLQQYDTSGSIPFLDLGNQYTLVGSQFQPYALRVGQTPNGNPYNWTVIASQLDNASSPIAQNIDGAANRLISAICKVDGNKPASVCSQTFAQQLSYVKTSGSNLQISNDVIQTPSIIPPRYVSNRFTILI